MTIEENLFARHRGKSVLLDSNLLLVFLTGRVGTHLFERFARVSRYSIDDYYLISQLIHSFRALITTPHILTEVSNLANKLSGSHRHDWYANLATLLTSEQEEVAFRENWESAKQLAALPDFIEFGITDSAVIKTASDALVVTDDFRLSGAMRSRGLDVLNFAHLRAMQGRLE